MDFLSHKVRENLVCPTPCRHGCLYRALVLLENRYPDQVLLIIEPKRSFLRDLCPAAVTPSLLTPKSTLTARERQIARLAAAGVPSKQIAEQIFLSPRTVDNHLLRIYVKLGVNGRAGLAAALRALGSSDPQ